MTVGFLLLVLLILLIIGLIACGLAAFAAAHLPI